MDITCFFSFHGTIATTLPQGVFIENYNDYSFSIKRPDLKKWIDITVTNLPLPLSLSATPYKYHVCFYGEKQDKLLKVDSVKFITGNECYNFIHKMLAEIY